MLLQSTLQLVAENDTLQSAIQRTERDTIEVITFLKKEDSQKDKQVNNVCSVQCYFLCQCQDTIVPLEFK